MAFTIKCTRCGAKLRGRDEHDAEVKFGNHTCKNKPDLSKLPLDLLRELAYGRITEEQAWERHSKGA